MLDHLRRIKSGGDLDSFKIDQIEKLEMDLRLLGTFVKYNHFLWSNSLVKIKEKARRIVKMLRRDFVGIPDECKTNLDLERLESQLLEVIDGNTSLSYNSELNDSDLSEYMDCFRENLNDVLKCHRESNRSYLKINQFIKQLEIVQKKMRFLRYLYATEINGYVNHEKLECLETRIHFMANNVGQFCLAVLVEVAESEDDIFNKPPYLLCLIVLVELEMKKIFLGELQASKFTQSKIFKDKKLPKGFSHQLHSLLMYLKNKKLENFPNNIAAENIDVAIEFLLVFLDADVSNHVNNGNWLNEVMEKVAAIAGDVLYVIQKILPRSIDKDDTSEIDIFSMQILEKTKDLKAPVESYYKSLKFTPSQFPTVGGLRFLDSLLSKLNEMLKSKSDLDFLMKPVFDNLERELSSLTSIFRDVAKMHPEHGILKDFLRRTINLAYEAEVAIDSILVHYNVFWHIFCSLPTILKEIKQINAEVADMWSADVALKPHYVVEPSKHLPSQHSNPVSDDDEIVGFEIATEKLIWHLTRGTRALDVIPIVGMGGQGKTTIAGKVYDNKIIVSHFDVRAWCIISQRYNRRDLLQKIFSQVTGSMDEGEKDDILADKLRKNLIERRYLIVLDDMWDVNAWDDLRACFLGGRNSSRIIVTTRLEKVGVQVKCHTDPYYLPFLTTEESCKLLH